MSVALPVLSGAALIKVLQNHGWEVARQSGSHVSLRNPQAGAAPLTVPLHKELKRGTLNGILNDAGLSREALVASLSRKGRRAEPQGLE